MFIILNMYDLYLRNNESITFDIYTAMAFFFSFFFTFLAFPGKYQVDRQNMHTKFYNPHEERSKGSGATATITT